MLAILLTCVEFTKQILTVSRTQSDLVIFGIFSPNNDSDLKKAKICYHKNSCSKVNHADYSSLIIFLILNSASCKNSTTLWIPFSRQFLLFFGSGSFVDVQCQCQAVNLKESL